MLLLSCQATNPAHRPAAHLAQELLGDAPRLHHRLQLLNGLLKGVAVRRQRGQQLSPHAVHAAAGGLHRRLRLGPGLLQRRRQLGAEARDLLARRGGVAEAGGQGRGEVLLRACQGTLWGAQVWAF